MTPQTPQGAALSDADIRDLVKESGLDWQRGYMPLFAGDDTNRYAVLVRAAIDADRRLTAEQGGALTAADLSRIVHEALGEASMMWEPRPTGVFKSSEVCEIAARLIAEILAALTTQPQAEPPTKEWCLKMARLEVESGADFEAGIAQPQAEPAIWTTKRLNEWVRNHYEDYPNIDAFLVGLGTAMSATPTAPTEPI